MSTSFYRKIAPLEDKITLIRGFDRAMMSLYASISNSVTNKRPLVLVSFGHLFQALAPPPMVASLELSFIAWQESLGRLIMGQEQGDGGEQMCQCLSSLSVNYNVNQLRVNVYQISLATSNLLTTAECHCANALVDSLLNLSECLFLGLWATIS